MSVIGSANDAQSPQSATESLATTVVALGQGYDSVAGKPRSTAVSGNTKTGGGISRSTVNVYTDLETLAESLDISQSFSASYGSFSGSEKGDFVRALKLTTYSVSIVVHVRQVTGTEEMSSFELKGGIDKPTDQASRLDFFLKYGDSFISSCTLGGEYIAIYTFYSQSESEKTHVMEKIGGKGSWDGVTVDASLGMKLQDLSQSVSTRSELKQLITGLEHPLVPSAKDIGTYGQKFSTLALDSPVIIEFETTGYEHVLGEGFATIANNRKYFVGTGLIGGLTKSLVAVQQLQDQIDTLNKIYDFYGYDSHRDTKLVTAADDAKSDLEKINGQMQAWENDPEPQGGFSPLVLKTANLGTPSLNFAFHLSDAYGPSGSDSPFDDVDILSYLQSHTRIKSVQLRTGDWVDCLMTTYESDLGTPVTRLRKHGGDGGSPTAELQLATDEYVSKVSGVYGSDYVLQLHITSTKNVTIGGGKYEASNKFDWSVPEKDAVVVGFAGRSGGYLDQVQVRYVTFGPAKWS